MTQSAERATTDQRTVEEFVRAAIERGIHWWKVTDCSGCGYDCGYVIEGEGVLYDSGCWCGTAGVGPLRPRSWEDLAEHYNRNQPSRNPKAEGTPWLAEMRAFWGFDQAVAYRRRPTSLPLRRNRPVPSPPAALASGL